MKKLLASIVLLFSINAVALAEEQQWVPISVGDITFFVPAGNSETQPSDPPAQPSITDQNLLNCLNTTMISQTWQTYSEVTSLYCAGKNIASIEGINILTNLEKLALGQNSISDISPLSGMQSLKWLHLASYEFSNELYNSDIQNLANLNNLTHLTVPSYKYDQGTELNVSAFPAGFSNLQTLDIVMQDDYIDCDTYEAIRARWNYQVQVGLSPDNTCQQNTP